MPIERPSVRDLLEQKVVVRPFVRILLAATVMIGGLAFVAFGMILFFSEPLTPYPHPVGAALLAVAVAAAGIGFFWIGVRLIRARTASSALLSPVARRRCSLIVGSLAVSMLVVAFETSRVLFFATAVGLILISYWLFPLERR